MQLLPTVADAAAAAAFWLHSQIMNAAMGLPMELSQLRLA